MAQPGMPGGQFPGEDAQGRAIKDLKRDMQQLAAANPLATAGISAVAGGILVDGSAEFTGDMTIGGTLSLPAGSVNNDALVQPLQISAIYADADAFTLTTTDQDFCVVSFTVPTGYTAATIDAIGTVNTYNTNGAADYLWAQAFINTTGGRRMFALMQATSGPASLTVNKQTQLTGLASGQVITCKLVLSSQVASVASTSNGASMSAKAFFTR